MKFLWLVLILIGLVSENSLAGNCGQCSIKDGNDQPLVKLPDLSILKDCPPEDETFLAQAQRQWQTFGSMTAPVTSVVRDLTLTDHPELIQMLDETLGKTPPSTFKKAINANCKNVQCVLEKIYGDRESALRVLLIQAQFGMRIQMDQSGNKKEYLFPKKELRWIHEAISKVPPAIRNTLELDDFVRRPPGDPKKGHETAAALASTRTEVLPGRITVQDLNSKIPGPAEDRTSFIQTILHEVGHHFDFKDLNKGPRKCWIDSNSFIGLFGWREIENEVMKDGVSTIETSWDRNRPLKPVTDYASTSPAEEFAEIFSYYMVSPQTLKASNPDQYAFLKHKVFNGMEFGEDKLSKQVESEFNKKGGLSSLLDYCKLGIHEEYSRKTQSIVPKSTIVETSTKISFKKFSKAAYFQQNECFEEYARKLLQSCDLTTEFCEAGGHSMILGWLTDRYSGDLGLLLDKIVQATP